MSSKSDTVVDFEEKVPKDLAEMPSNVKQNLLPEKSKRQYTSAYSEFKEWCKERKKTDVDEEIILAYLDDLSKNLAPSTLWARYSMLKATINTFENVDISTYKTVQAFLKRKSESHKRKKSKVFSPTEVSKFCNEASDEIYLLHKVVFVIGLSGGCRREELANITVQDVKDVDGKILLVTIPNMKSGVERSFTVVGEFYNICKTYRKLRPKDCKCHRFFLNYRAGKCTNQPVGINKIGAMPSVIASFLNLPNPELYTGHSFRRTSAKLLVEAGGDINTFKKLGRWKSMSVAEGYVESSVAPKSKIEEQISNSISISVSSTSKCSSDSASTSTVNSSYPLTHENSREEPKSKYLKTNSKIERVDEQEVEEIFCSPLVRDVQECPDISCSDQSISISHLRNERFSFQLNNCSVNFVINENSNKK